MNCKDKEILKFSKLFKDVDSNKRSIYDLLIIAE